MNGEIRVECGSSFVGLIRFILLSALLMVSACRENSGPSPEFSANLDKLKHWTNKGWDGYTYQEEKLILDTLCRDVQVELNMTRRDCLYAQLTNTLANVPFFSTNGVRRTNEYPRGWYQPPYWYRLEDYRNLIERVQKRSPCTNRYDSFCLELEMWKRLQREKNECKGTIESWMTSRYEDSPRRRDWMEGDIRETLAHLGSVIVDVERSLENFYNKESDESRRAYELFRQVIGREAKTQYRRTRPKVNAHSESKHPSSL